MDQMGGLASVCILTAIDATSPIPLLDHSIRTGGKESMLGRGRVRLGVWDQILFVGWWQGCGPGDLFETLSPSITRPTHGFNNVSLACARRHSRLDAPVA